MGSNKPRSISSDSYSSCSEEENVSNSDHDSFHDKHGTNDDHGHSNNDQRRNNNHGGSNDEHTHENYHGGSRDGLGGSQDHGGSKDEHAHEQYHGGSRDGRSRNFNDHGGSNNNHEGSYDEEGGRLERSPHYRYPRGRNSYKSYRRKQGSETKTHTVSEVIMPSGRKTEISQLVLTKYECGAKTKLKQLYPRKREYQIVETEMQESIVNHYDCKNSGGCFKRYNIVKVEKVLQGCAWRKYDNRRTDVKLENNGKTNEKMLFHGSTEVGAIIEKGFDERHANANGKLGAGIYFTPKSSAANQFIFGFYGGDGCKRHRNKNCYICERQLLLCRVTLGRCKKFIDTSVGQIVHPEPGYHSAVGIPGEGAFEYKEYVIYRGEQAYPEYLITYKIVEERHHNH